MYVFMYVLTQVQKFNIQHTHIIDIITRSCKLNTRIVPQLLTNSSHVCVYQKLIDGSTMNFIVIAINM